MPSMLNNSLTTRRHISCAEVVPDDPAKVCKEKSSYKNPMYMMFYFLDITQILVTMQVCHEAFL